MEELLTIVKEQGIVDIIEDYRNSIEKYEKMSKVNEEFTISIFVIHNEEEETTIIYNSNTEKYTMYYYLQDIFVGRTYQSLLLKMFNCCTRVHTISSDNIIEVIYDKVDYEYYRDILRVCKISFGYMTFVLGSALLLN